MLQIDALTGVASRAAWEETLAVEELHRSRSGARYSVVVVDVDGLKAVNDGDGHAAGDELLRACARLLADNTRATDIVARIGGDEFGAILRHSDEQQGAAWCEPRDAPGRAERRRRRCRDAPDLGRLRPDVERSDDRRRARAGGRANVRAEAVRREARAAA